MGSAIRREDGVLSPHFSTYGAVSNVCQRLISIYGNIGKASHVCWQSLDLF